MAPTEADAPATAPAQDTTRSSVLLAVFVVLVAAQLVAVYWPRVDVPGPVGGTDKLAHALLFAAPTAVGLLAGLRPVYVVGAIAAHAPVSELVQHFFLPHRTGDVADVVADLVGVVLGVTLVVVGRALRR